VRELPRVRGVIRRLSKGRGEVRNVLGTFGPVGVAGTTSEISQREGRKWNVPV